ncbi:MAG: hypothetical protein HC802_13330 [Caldilineaceae bacterium]|nr:hypothetical protein [Caldilineaceae bacterium]
MIHGWGFDEIILPGFDSADDFSDQNGLYSLIDREGHRLALRADFTQMASKALAMELRREARQIRATYEGRVYRFQPSGHGRRVEQTQRGLEWVNARGAVYDVVVDLRPQSPTHGQWIAEELSADNGNMLYCPAGCAHGFLTLSDDTELLYLISGPYRSEAACGVHWQTPAAPRKLCDWWKLPGVGAVD